MTVPAVSGPSALTRATAAWRRKRETIGFVPTMGALHEGHRSLMRRARRENDRVVVSIFVNPLQFGPAEDLARYPRPATRDRRLCGEEGVDLLYRPSAAAMYPPGFQTTVDVPGLGSRLEGTSRPGHFRGVATVVLKLFQQVRPRRAYFGEKDFQQLAVVRRLARDLDTGIEIVPCPIVRAADGLALSSRNAYLSPKERAQAPAFHRALREAARAASRQGATPATVTGTALRALRPVPGLRVEYVSLVDASTLEPAARLRGRLRLLGAVRLGRTRLIDNVPVICDD